MLLLSVLLFCFRLDRVWNCSHKKCASILQKVEKHCTICCSYDDDGLVASCGGAGGNDCLDDSNNIANCTIQDGFLQQFKGNSCPLLLLLLSVALFWLSLVWILVVVVINLVTEVSNGNSICEV